MAVPEYNLETDASAQRSGTTTHASIFLKLKLSDPRPREIAWSTFHARYAPVIARYALKRGAGEHEAEEVVQEVMIGFFGVAPRFRYDPARGRFRSYLGACVARALAKVRGAGRRERVHSVPLDEIDVADQAADSQRLWEKIWAQEQLRRAMADARAFYQSRGKLQSYEAFERCVVHRQSPAEVAKKLGMTLNGVHAAKMRVTRKLRELQEQFGAEDD